MSTLSRRQVQITSSLGFHLRGACRFVQLSRQFEAVVQVFCNGRAADGRSVLDLMMLAAGCGAELVLEATGPDAEAAAARLCAFFTDELRDDSNDADQPRDP